MLFSESKQFANRLFRKKLDPNQPIREDNLSETLGNVKVFARSLAHDINNLLAAMLLNIDYAELFIDNGNSMVVGETLTEMKNILHKATKLTVKMSSFNILDGMKPERVNAVNLVEATQLFSLEGEISISYNIDQSIVYVVSEQNKFREVISNLVMEAIEAINLQLNNYPVNLSKNELSDYLGNVKALISNSDVKTTLTKDCPEIYGDKEDD